MIRIGVDVGGTNTDAVVMQSEEFLGGAKSPTTQDILSGVESAIKAALNQAKTESKDVIILQLFYHLTTICSYNIGPSS